MQNDQFPGINGVLGSLTGDQSGSPSKPAQPQPTPAEPRLDRPISKKIDQPAPRIIETNEREPERTKKPAARLGRPPGRKTGATARKRKTTLWVSAELMDAYTDWSWEERCNLGELVERALRDYRRRNGRLSRR